MAMMNDDVMVTVEALLEYGVISEDGCRRFADFIRNLKAFAGVTVARSYVPPLPASLPPTASLGPRQAPMADMNPLDRVQTYDAPAESPRQRAKRGAFNPSVEELRRLREAHTAREIAEQFGVSTATVNNRARELGLTSPRGNGGGKKGRKKKGT